MQRGSLDQKSLCDIIPFSMDVTIGTEISHSAGSAVP